MKNKYLVFMGSRYYPRGGMRDYIGCANTVIGCKRLVSKAEQEDRFITESELWAHIFCVKTSRIVMYGEPNSKCQAFAWSIDSFDSDWVC